MRNDLAVIIMAAGLGKRMKNPAIAKVMHLLDGIPLIGHVVHLAQECNADRIITIVGHQKEAVIEYLHDLNSSVEIAVQDQQLGTAHAVLQTEPYLTNFEGNVIILSGDVPLLKVSTLQAMLSHHSRTNAAVTILTANLPDPTGYGRIVRDGGGNILKIIEHKDASEDERTIQEINSGVYVFQKRPLFTALSQVSNDNVQGEYYLPDVFCIFASNDLRMESFSVASIDEIRGVNTVEQLLEMETIYMKMKEAPRNWNV